MRTSANSRPLAAVIVAIALLATGLVVTAASPALAASVGPDVSYPLRHSFSMAPGIPGAGGHEVTSCFDAHDSPEYYCRIVAGIEEVGDNRNFLVYRDDALDQGSDPTYGHELVARDGISYEGCQQWRNGDWFCDYQTRNPVSKRHYDAGQWVFNVFWSWQKYARGQAACAAALSAFWADGGGRSFGLLLGNCSNGPMERPQ